MSLIEKVAVEVAKDVYDDGLKPATKEVGGALETIVGWFNHVVLHPVKKANFNYQHKLIKFKDELEESVKAIPPEYLVNPPLQIAGPALESLKYTFDDDALKDMFLKLLTSSMDSRKEGLAHVSFVDIIKNLSSTDASVLNFFSNVNQIPCAKVTMGFDNQVFTGAMPSTYVPVICQQLDPFVVSKSIHNLIRLGLIKHTDNGINSFNYEGFKDEDFLKKRARLYKNLMLNDNEFSEKTFNLDLRKETLFVNEFGRAFLDACLSDS